MEGKGDGPKKETPSTTDQAAVSEPEVNPTGGGTGGATEETPAANPVAPNK